MRKPPSLVNPIPLRRTVIHYQPPRSLLSRRNHSPDPSLPPLPHRMPLSPHYTTFLSRFSTVITHRPSELRRRSHLDTDISFIDRFHEAQDRYKESSSAILGWKIALIVAAVAVPLVIGCIVLFLLARRRRNIQKRVKFLLRNDERGNGQGGGEVWSARVEEEGILERSSGEEERRPAYGETTGLVVNKEIDGSR